jgi:hypothetical protein
MAVILSLSTLFASQGLAFEKRPIRFDRDLKGLGLIAGQPLSARYQLWTSWRRAWYYDVGYNFDKAITGSANYTFYFYDVKDLWKSKNKMNALLFFISPGVFAGYRTQTQTSSEQVLLGGRVVGGVEYAFAGRSFSLRAEVGPAVYVFGRTFSGLQGGLGLMYYFGGNSSKKSSESSKANDKNEEKSDDELLDELEI